MDGEATDKPQSERIATNLRTLLIIEVVGNANRALTPTEINEQLGLPKQTIHRLCATLVRDGFLAYEPDGRHLRPARRLRNMASGVLHASRIHIARHQILEELAATVGETVNFVVPEDDGMSYLDRVETDWAFRVQLPVGTHVPFHCTASGKCFLASLSKHMRDRMLESVQLERLTERTITDTKALHAELALVRKRGYALDIEEFMSGMVAIAVPVLDPQERFLAALAFHGPTIRLNENALLKHLRLLQDCAARLAATLIGH